MKKFLCVLLAITAMSCFAGCADGKCDSCKTEEHVKEYTLKDGDKVEYCPSCYAKAVADNLLGGLLG